METNLKYIIYCRKSSEHVDRQALSIDAQKRELLEFAQKNNFKVVQILEESQSAYKLGRPIFDRMLSLLTEGLANAILVWKPDRLARNALDGGRVIQTLDDKVVQEIRTPYELFRQEDNRMMLYIHFGMSNDYSRQISANVKRGNRQKYERGEYLGVAPLGYVNAKVGNSRNIIIDPVKAPLIKRMFVEYATGNYSVQSIRKKAIEWGLTNRSKKGLTKSNVYDLLKKHVYYGVFQHAGELHQGSYEPIISKQLFDQVQDILNDRGKPRKQTWIHAYKGLVKCVSCGSSITAETKTKYFKGTNRYASYTYYRCTRRRGPCGQPGVTEAELEEMIKQNISKIEIDREIWKLGVDLLKAKHSNEVDIDIQVRKQLEKEKDKVDLELDKLLQMRLNEEITADEYAEAKRKLVDRQMELKAKTEDRENTSANWLELAENFFETAFQAREILEGNNPEQKKELVRTVGWNLILNNKNLEFSFRKPFDVLLQPSIRTDMQGWKESDPR
jgi:site-specific DNA recombinase